MKLPRQKSHDFCYESMGGGTQTTQSELPALSLCSEHFWPINDETREMRSCGTVVRCPARSGCGGAETVMRIACRYLATTWLIGSMAASYAVDQAPLVVPVIALPSAGGVAQASNFALEVPKDVPRLLPIRDPAERSLEPKSKEFEVAPVTFVNVSPPLVLTCHCTVGVGLPLASAVNVTCWPAITD